LVPSVSGAANPPATNCPAGQPILESLMNPAGIYLSVNADKLKTTGDINAVCQNRAGLLSSLLT
jgi:hypothetical protein